MRSRFALPAVALAAAALFAAGTPAVAHSPAAMPAHPPVKAVSGCGYYSGTALTRRGDTGLSRGGSSGCPFVEKASHSGLVICLSTSTGTVTTYRRLPL
jgi:hypothetical protein